MTEVNVGLTANDGTGDPLRTAFVKINTDISALKQGLSAIEQVPDATALIAARDIAVAAAEQAEDERILTQAAAVEAALYDGPKVDTFSQLATVTPAMLGVGGLVRVIETGNVYRRVSSGGDLDYSGAGGVRFQLVLQSAYINNKGVLISDQGGATFADKLSSAKAVIASRGYGYLFLKPTDSFALAAGTRLEAGRYVVDFGGAELDASALSTGTAMEIVPHSTDLRVSQSPVYGLRIIGSDNEANTADLLSVGRPGDFVSGNTAQLAFYDLYLSGGRDALVLGEQTWLNKFYNPMIRGAKRRGASLLLGANAGENVSFIGGVIADCKNAAKTAVGLYMDVGANANVHCYGFSLDYSDIQARVDSGFLLLSGCHVEDNSTRAQIVISSTGGFEPGKFMATGTTFTGSGIGTESEPTTGRDSFIDVSGGRSQVIIEGGQWPRFGKSTGQLVRVTADSPLVRVNGVDPQLEANKVPAISNATNLVTNGGFESDFAGWTPSVLRNFVRNGAMVGAVAGSPGTAPTGWSVLGALNGLTRTLAIEYVNGKPALVLSLSGTPSATSTYGFYFEGSTSIPASQAQTWEYGAQVSVRKSTGATFGIGLVERDSGGSNVASGSVGILASPLRKPVKASRTLTAATAAFAQPSVYIAYTNGVAVDAQIVIDTPLLQLAGSGADAVVNEDPVAAVNGTRWAIDTGTVNSGTKALRIDSAAADSLEFYRDVPISGGRGLMLRGFIGMASRSAGAADLFVRWLDAAGAEIGSARAGSAVSANTSFTMIGNQVRAPTGAVTARICCRADALTGTARFDDVSAWVI